MTKKELIGKRSGSDKHFPHLTQNFFWNHLSPLAFLKYPHIYQLLTAHRTCQPTYSLSFNSLSLFPWGNTQAKYISCTHVHSKGSYSHWPSLNVIFGCTRESKFEGDGKRRWGTRHKHRTQLSQGSFIPSWQDKPPGSASQHHPMGAPSSNLPSSTVTLNLTQGSQRRKRKKQNLSFPPEPKQENSGTEQYQKNTTCNRPYPSSWNKRGV